MKYRVVERTGSIHPVVYEVQQSRYGFWWTYVTLYLNRNIAVEHAARMAELQPVQKRVIWESDL